MGQQGAITEVCNTENRHAAKALTKHLCRQYRGGMQGKLSLHKQGSNLTKHAERHSRTFSRHKPHEQPSFISKSQCTESSPCYSPHQRRPDAHDAASIGTNIVSQQSEYRPSEYRPSEYRPSDYRPPEQLNQGQLLWPRLVTREISPGQSSVQQTEVTRFALG